MLLRPLYPSAGKQLIALLAFSLLTLVGCVRPEDDKVRLQFSFWGSIEQQKVENAIVAGFESTHSDILIETLPIGQRYADKIQAMMIGNVAPDIIMADLRMLDEWSSRGALLDITNDMCQIMEEYEIMAIPLRAAERNGKFFGAPVNASGVGVFVNLTALKQAGIDIPDDGLSWDFIEDIAPRLSRRHGDPSASTDYALLLPGIMKLVWAHGGDFFDNPNNPTKVTINSPEAVEALTRYRSLLQSGYAVPPDVSLDQGTFQLFRDGKIAFYFDGRWRTPDFRAISEFDWDVLPVPSGPAGRLSRHYGTFIAISPQTKHPEQAREFLRYYAAGEGVKISTQGGRTTPVYAELAYGEDFLNSSPPQSMHVFSDTMQAGASTTYLYGRGQIEVEMIIRRRMQQLTAFPNLSVEDILSGLEKDLNRWLERNKQ